MSKVVKCAFDFLPCDIVNYIFEINRRDATERRINKLINLTDNELIKIDKKLFEKMNKEEIKELYNYFCSKNANNDIKDFYYEYGGDADSEYINGICENELYNYYPPYIKHINFNTMNIIEYYESDLINNCGDNIDRFINLRYYGDMLYSIRDLNGGNYFLELSKLEKYFYLEMKRGAFNFLTFDGTNNEEYRLENIFRIELEDYDLYECDGDRDKAREYILENEDYLKDDEEGIEERINEIIEYYEKTNKKLLKLEKLYEEKNNRFFEKYTKYFDYDEINISFDKDKIDILIEIFNDALYDFLSDYTPPLIDMIENIYDYELQHDYREYNFNDFCENRIKYYDLDLKDKFFMIKLYLYDDYEDIDKYITYIK